MVSMYIAMKSIRNDIDMPQSNKCDIEKFVVKQYRCILQEPPNLYIMYNVTEKWYKELIIRL